MIEMTTQTVYPFLTRTYARNIYLYGNERLTQRDGYNGIPLEYHQSVKQYAAMNFTISPYATADCRTTQIDLALTNGWISQQEYTETIAYIPLNF